MHLYNRDEWIVIVEYFVAQFPESTFMQRIHAAPQTFQHFNSCGHHFPARKMTDLNLCWTMVQFCCSSKHILAFSKPMH